MYTLEQRIEEVKRCLDCKMWQAALALALTIPDICGQIKFRNLKKINANGKEINASIGDKYNKWFHEYVESYFADDKGWDQEGFAVNPYFTGDMCYQLRCAFLHSGEDAANKKNNKIKYQFSLRINACDAIHMKTERENEIDSVIVDISNLCNYICKGALQFYHEWERPDDFNDRKCEWLDLDEWSECMKSLNNLK